MPELRKDPIVGRWVVVNVEEPFTPADFKHDPIVFKGPHDCPFCPGKESITGKEIEAVSFDPKRIADSLGWAVRTVANKYPALRIEGALDSHGQGMYDSSNGIGAHEVIIETPDHFKEIPELEPKEVQAIIKTYQSRSLDLRKDKRFKYILIFKNVGASAGASQEHGHSQLIALPMVPKNVKEEIKGAKHYYEFRERCIFCDMIAYEQEHDQENVVCQNNNFIAFCPMSSRFSFETWILPKEHACDFAMTGDDLMPDLAGILKETLARLKKVLGPHSYNYIIHTSPVNTEVHFSYHWHIEIMPRLSKVAGFEWGSGFYVVMTPPENAAKYLREV